ncbi:MAG: Ku protein [Ilumatobacter sp.]|uniref:non-homologous end joining protein Ku n=1 Tax=Ilumatobacter sp. TaxID=1967498 RepID=UPI003C77B27C
MARPVWSGTISFGLVAIPVKLFHAVRKKSVSFNQLDERNMARIRYRKVNGETGEEVADEHIVKAYEVSKGSYVVIDPDELEPFMPAATKTIDLEEFVDLDQIDPVYFDTAYHLAPDVNAKPYALLAQAMEASGKVGIGRYVMRNKQYTAAIRAEEGRLVMSSLAYADEVVDPAEIDAIAELADIEVSDKEVLMAESLVASLSADFEPWKYHDEYREQVMTLIEMKRDGQEMVAPTAETEAPKVIDIMAALEASVAAAKASRASHPARKAAAAKWGAKASADADAASDDASTNKPTAKQAARSAAATKRKTAAAGSGSKKKSAAKKSVAKKKSAAKKKVAAKKKSAAKKQAARKTAAKKSA